MAVAEPVDPIYDPIRGRVHFADRVQIELGNSSPEPRVGRQDVRRSDDTGADRRRILGRRFRDVVKDLAEVPHGTFCPYDETHSADLRSTSSCDTTSPFRMSSSPMATFARRSRSWAMS